MEKSKSILIVDDHPVVLVGLRALILQDGVYKNVQTASSPPICQGYHQQGEYRYRYHRLGTE